MSIEWKRILKDDKMMRYTSHVLARWTIYAATAVGVVIVSSAQQVPVAPAGSSVSTGLATNLIPVLPTEGCTNPKASVQPDVFPTRVGTVKSTDGKDWIVPGPIQQGAVAVDLYNDCTGTGDNPDWQKQLVPVVIDPDGV